MELLDTEELANMIRRECEARGITPAGTTPLQFESRMLGFNRRYLVQMFTLLGLGE